MTLINHFKFILYDDISQKALLFLSLVKWINLLYLLIFIRNYIN